MRYWLLVVGFLSSLAACAQEAPSSSGKYVEGKHYAAIKAPVPTVVDNSKQVEVTEVFRFGCPACARFETAAKNWKASKAPYIEFVKNPVVWNKVTEKRAAVYFTGKFLGLEQETADAIFAAIHEKATSQAQANSALTKDADILAMFESLGADKAKAESLLKGFGVKAMVNKADGRTRSFAISGTPEIFVDGRYSITTKNAKDYGEMLEIASFLAEKIAKERGIISAQ